MKPPADIVERLNAKAEIVSFAPHNTIEAEAAKEITTLRSRVTELERGLEGLNAHIERMQDRMRSYLQPDGDEDRLFIGDMIYLLDGPEQREAQNTARKLLGQRDG